MYNELKLSVVLHIVIWVGRNAVQPVINIPKICHLYYQLFILLHYYTQMKNTDRRNKSRLLKI